VIIIEKPVIYHQASTIFPEVKSVVMPHVQASPKQAEVTIQVAQGSKLLVDGKEINLTSSTERFLTPELDPSRIYFYEMKATAKQDGKELSASKRVAVKAGEKVAVDLRDLKGWTLPTPEQEEVAKVTVKLPENAELYVDGVRLPQFSGERTFNSPPLTRGQTFHYTFKAEIKREGKTLSDTQKVSVQAGKTVSVNFEQLPVRAASR